MAWYAELKRRQWYCINGIRMNRVYSKMLYDEWWESLTEEQRERIREHRRKRSEQSEREFRTALMNMAVITATVCGLSRR